MDKTYERRRRVEADVIITEVMTVEDLQDPQQEYDSRGLDSEPQVRIKKEGDEHSCTTWELV